MILMAPFQLWVRLLKVCFLHGANKEIHEIWSAGKFWIYPWLKCLKYPIKTFFKLRTNCLPSTPTTFQSSINHKIGLPQGDFGLLIVRLQLALRGSHIPHTRAPQLKACWWLTLNEEIRSSCLFWLSLYLPKGTTVNTDKSRVTPLHHRLLLI